MSSTAIPDASVLELYPDERNRLVLICTAVSRKFIGRMNTLENLVALANEIEDRCREELSLEVVCDPMNEELAEDGKTLYFSPSVTPIQRLTPEPFDFARARYETQQGFDDGVPGAITEDGRWIEPTKLIALPGGSGVAGD